MAGLGLLVAASDKNYSPEHPIYRLLALTQLNYQRAYLPIHTFSYYNFFLYSID